MQGVAVRNGGDTVANGVYFRNQNAIQLCFAFAEILQHWYLAVLLCVEPKTDTHPLFHDLQDGIVISTERSPFPHTNRQAYWDPIAVSGSR